MQLIINLPNREETLAFHRQRWEEVTGDRWLSQYQGKVETNALGQIIMTPPPRFLHGRLQTEISARLNGFRGGVSATETGVITSDGVKVIDVVWLSQEFYCTLDDPSVLERAPEICIEILSPTNTKTEIENKFRLYFEAGAIECWQCDLDEKMTYCLDQNVEQPSNQSKLCPEFPSEISH